MKLAMRFRWLLLSLFILPVAHAASPPRMPIDLIELLGEFDDAETELLENALDTIKSAKTPAVNNKEDSSCDVQEVQEVQEMQSKPLSQETKK